MDEGRAVKKPRILGGLRVLDLTRFLSGPQATLFLSDLGAEIIRIDDPATGDPSADAPPFSGPKASSSIDARPTISASPSPRLSVEVQRDRYAVRKSRASSAAAQRRDLSGAFSECQRANSKNRPQKEESEVSPVLRPRRPN